MACYSERLPIPQQTTFGLKDGQVGDEIEEKRRTRKAIIRNVEVDLIMNLETAEIIKEWLGRHIDNLKERLAEIEERDKGGSQS